MLTRALPDDSLPPLPPTSVIPTSGDRLDDVRRATRAFATCVQWMADARTDEEWHAADAARAQALRRLVGALRALPDTMRSTQAREVSEVFAQSRPAPPSQRLP